jgi:hypothetical protein
MFDNFERSAASIPENTTNSNGNTNPVASTEFFKTEEIALNIQYMWQNWPRYRVQTYPKGQQTQTVTQI